MKILGFDTETTGTQWADGHRIIEIALVLVHDGVRKAAYTQRFNPQRPIDAKATEVHGITFEEVSGEPLFEEKAGKISALMNCADVIVAHNGVEFDVPFINHEFRGAGVPEIGNVPIVDTMLDGRWATPFGKNPSLGELCFALGVPYDKAQAHAALYDVDVMLEAFHRARAKGFFTIPQREMRMAA
jgi:DNA polymerase-3 subunit epsilon